MKESLIWTTQPIFISIKFSDKILERDVKQDFVFNEETLKAYVLLKPRATGSR